jgi:hypothetical protein
MMPYGRFRSKASPPPVCRGGGAVLEFGPGRLVRLPRPSPFLIGAINPAGVTTDAG